MVHVHLATQNLFAASSCCVLQRLPPFGRPDDEPQAWPMPSHPPVPADYTKPNPSALLPQWYMCHYPHLHVLFVWLLAFCLHLPTLAGSFVWDDRAAVVNNRDVHRALPRTNSTWNDVVPPTLFTDDFWGAPLSLPNSHKSYRPLTVLTYRLNFLLHEFHPRGYHVVNVVLHATVCALVLVVGRDMLSEAGSPVQREVAAMMAALLFLVHPIHVESVCSIVGRADSLCGLFYLAAFLVYAHSARSVYGTLVAYMLGLAAFLSKEVGLTVLGLFVVQDLFPSLVPASSSSTTTIWSFVREAVARLGRPAVAARVAGCFLCLVGVLVLRLQLHGERLLMRWSPLENEIVHMEPRPARVLAVAHVHFVYLWKLLFPFRQSYDYGFACIHHVATFLDPRNALALGTYALALAAVYHGLTRRRKEIVLPLALLLASFLPASHAFFFVGAVVAERLLYLPSVGMCILVGALVSPHLVRASGPSRHRRFLLLLLAGGSYVVLFAAQTLSYASLWTGGEALVFAHARRVCPSSAKVLNNYALGFVNATHARHAVAELSAALVVYPQYANAHYNKGLCHFFLGEHKDARAHFSAVVQAGTCNLQTYSLLGQAELFLYEQHRRHNDLANAAALAAQAELHLDIALQHGLDLARTYHFRGALALQLEQPQAAVAFLEKALDTHQQEQQAEDMHQQDGDVNPVVVRTPSSSQLDAAAACNLLGLAYKALGRVDQAQQAFLRGLAERPRAIDLMGNVGLLLLEGGKGEEAREWFRKALEVNSKSYELLNNMVSLERVAGWCFSFSQTMHLHAHPRPTTGSGGGATWRLQRGQAVLSEGARALCRGGGCTCGHPSFLFLLFCKECERRGGGYLSSPDAPCPPRQHPTGRAKFARCGDLVIDRKTVRVAL